MQLNEVFSGKHFEFPVDMFPWPGRGMAVVDKEGHILVHFKTGLPRLVLNLIDKTASEGSESGMLSAALDPDFDEFPFLYIYYSVRGDDEKTRLSRFTVVDDGVRQDSELVILEIPQPADIHNGGDIVFDSDGMLYLGLGDGGTGVWERQSQRLDNLWGSIIRIDVRGATEERPYKVPSDNPLVANPDARPEIWAWGLRNPWRMDIDPESGKIWVGDVGLSNVEEITVVEVGTNHGWPLFEGSECTTDATGVTEEECLDAVGEVVFPVHEYLHSDDECAVIGGYVYRGTAISWLQGAYIFGDFCTSNIWALTHVGESEWESQHILTVEPHRRITSFAIDEEGEIYVLTIDGPILKIVGTSDVAD